MRRANATDFEQLTDFYRYVAEHTKDMERYGRWVYGQHPTDEMILEYIKQEAMYLLEENGTILAAAAVTMCQGKDYHGIVWKQKVKDDEVAVVHILCVNPEYQKKKIGKWVMEECISLAEREGKRFVRLDALESNTPAHKLYEALGFQCRGKQELFAENTGWTNFLFFEYAIN